MARHRRVYSSTGLYHIVMKGIDKKYIFHDAEDKYRFLSSMAAARENGGFKVFAYCLMDNHVHLVVMEKEEIGNSIRRFAVSYVKYYHKKYGTSGHFFSNRFHSDPIETEGYLMRAIRYAHQNPVRAGIINQCADYPWSSYNEYLDGNIWTDASDMTDLFSSMNAFVSFHEEKEDVFMEGDKGTAYQRMTILLEEDGYKVDDLSKPIRNYLIIKTFKTLGIKKSYIADYFGISRDTVRRILQGV